jgi:hypothetical protein
MAVIYYRLTGNVRRLARIAARQQGRRIVEKAGALAPSRV